MLISELKTDKKVVGVKQTRKAAGAGRTRRVFLALDADPEVTEPIARLCREKNIPVESVFTMRELGEACGIAVGAAAAAVLNS